MRSTHKTRSNAGCALSSLLVNVYLDHCLDRPWRKRQREAPLLRTADDILILAHSPAQAERLYRDLAQRLTSAGVPLKGTRDTAIQDLARGGQAQWLGFCVGMEAGRGARGSGRAVVAEAGPVVGTGPREAARGAGC